VKNIGQHLTDTADYVITYFFYVFHVLRT